MEHNDNALCLRDGFLLRGGAEQRKYECFIFSLNMLYMYNLYKHFFKSIFHASSISYEENLLEKKPKCSKTNNTKEKKNQF